jgi:tetratricopeptide (TPR) repeat protein
MTKLLIILVILALPACGGSPNVRPDTYSKGENLLQSGLIAYRKDDFPAALQKFNSALLFYQSLDDNRGMQLSRINLVETSLALSDFAAAEQQLRILKEQAADGFLDETFKNRIILLEVKLLFQQQRYQEALAAIEPLLLQLDTQELTDNKRLNLLATAARLETLISAGTKPKWLDQFRVALAQEQEPRQPKFQIILKRIDALIASQKQQYHEALKLLHEALDYYKLQADRRAIASCLEEIAVIELAQNNKYQALEYLKRSLAIHTWLKDQYNIDKNQQKIMQISLPGSVVPIR